MKNIICISILILCNTYLALGQYCDRGRQTIWLMGHSTTSRSYDGTQGALDDEYGFCDMMPATNTQYHNAMDEGMASVTDFVKGRINPAGTCYNTLGIGHDFGGLVLRSVEKVTQPYNLSAMILNGVPNTSPQSIEEIIGGNNGNFTIDNFIEQIENLQDGFECDGKCGVIDAFETWVEQVQDGKESIASMLDETPQDLPDIPYAVLWGNDSETSVTSLLSSLSSISDAGVYDDNYTDCFDEQISNEMTEAEHEENQGLLSQIGGFLGNVFNTLVKTIKDGEVTNALSLITGIAESIFDTITDRIDSKFEKDSEISRILKCKLVNDIFVLDWTRLVSQEINVQSGYTWSDFSSCYSACLQENGWSNSSHCGDLCLEGFEHADPIVTFQPHDGLYSKTEQLLDGAFPVYELKNTNHFQENSSHNIDHLNFMQDLFQGSAGIPFMVPLI